RAASVEWRASETLDRVPAGSAEGFAPVAAEGAQADGAERGKDEIECGLGNAHEHGSQRLGANRVQRVPALAPGAAILPHRSHLAARRAAVRPVESVPELQRAAILLEG